MSLIAGGVELPKKRQWRRVPRLQLDENRDYLALVRHRDGRRSPYYALARAHAADPDVRTLTGDRVVLIDDDGDLVDLRQVYLLFPLPPATQMHRERRVKDRVGAVVIECLRGRLR